MTDPKYQIIDKNGDILYSFKDYDGILFSECFSFSERQELKKSLDQNQFIKEGSLKGMKLIKEQ